MFAIINGPNLNLLGKRQPEIYGKESFDSFLCRLRERFSQSTIEYFQSNSEGEIIDIIHKLGFENPVCKGIVLNPGAYSHYSYAIADAIRAVTLPVVEVHISHIMGRESFRQLSVTAPACNGMITGFGLEGYSLAISFLTSL